MRCSDKVIVITGAGAGIGRGSAIALAANGAKLVLVGRTLSKLEETRAECAGAEVATVEADASEAASVENVFSSAVERFGRVDVLFNNAGIGLPARRIEDVALEQWHAILASNLTSAFLCTQAAVRVMKSQDPKGGRIINNGSVSAHVPRPLAAPYTITKHAITGLTRATALEGRGHNIACGQIDIGNALTKLTRRMAVGVVQSDGSTAVEAVIDLEHVADAVVAMAALPLEANVLSMTIMATAMPFVGRG
jgi:NAD(P)-dependent dehydrogenase (short-subunit alcohol dehydrogenase family)